jgi:hypothetical protein
MRSMVAYPKGCSSMNALASTTRPKGIPSVTFGDNVLCDVVEAICGGMPPKGGAPRKPPRPKTSLFATMPCENE